MSDFVISDKAKTTNVKGNGGVQGYHKKFNATGTNAKDNQVLPKNKLTFE